MSYTSDRLVSQLPERSDSTRRTSTIEDKLVVDHLTVSYYTDRTDENYCAVQDVSFTVREHEFVTVIGPSGCGKSTLLKVVAGVLPYQGGRLLLDGKPVVGPGSDRAVVFQSASLLPWRSVLGNVAYGLELRKVPKEKARKKAAEMLALVGLANYQRQYPNELSGGMQQRVNLARALAVDPELVLMDEPFSALDAQTRETLGYETLRIWEETGATAMFVTHQIDEAVFLSDRVVVLSPGPGSVVADIVTIELPRPRTEDMKEDPAFIEPVAHIRGLVRGSRASARIAQDLRITKDLEHITSVKPAYTTAGQPGGGARHPRP